MFTFQSMFLYETIWRIRRTEEIRSIFEVGSEQLQYNNRKCTDRASKSSSMIHPVIDKLLLAPDMQI